VRCSLTPSIRAASYPFVHRIRTRFAETDAMGVIHHGAYATYLEEARVGMLRDAGHSYDEVRQAGLDFAVIELFVRYRKPLRFDELVDVSVAVGTLTRAKFQVAYLLQVAGDTRATAVTVHAVIDGAGKGVRIPAWLRDLVGRAPTISGPPSRR
jgi:acyl-CoA thioester hydrolase